MYRKGRTFQRGKIWHIDFCADGRRIRESTNSTNKKFAEMVLAKRLVEVAEGKFLDVRKVKKIKFEDFSKEYLALHSKLKRSYDTDCKIVELLKKFFGGKYLYEISSLDIEKFKSARANQVKGKSVPKKTISPATVNRDLAVLKSIFNKAILWGKAERNPCKGVKLFKENNQRLRFLEKEEIGKLLETIDKLILLNKHDQYVHLKPIIIIALHTGMRKGEILGLKWRDIDIKRNIIHLVNTKNGEKREVPMNEAAQKTIISVLKNPESQYIFCNKYGQPYGDVRKSFFTAIEKSGIVDFHFHDLRHTFASQLVMSGVDLNTVRELLGHKSLEMTLRYSHLSPDHKKRAVDLLGQRMCPKSGTNLAQRPNLASAIEEAAFDNSLVLREIH